MNEKIEMKTWEINNSHSFTGWEVHYGFDNVIDGKKEWVRYDGFYEVIFKNGKEIVKTFQIPDNETPGFYYE